MMLVLHAGWLAGGLALWGELPAAAAVLEPTGAKELQAVLERLGLPPEEPATVTAWLPGTPEGAVPSGPLTGAVPVHRTVLSALGVAALRLAPAAALGLLLSVTGEEPLAPGLVAGTDVRFWAAAARLARSLTVRQRFLPGVVSDAEGWRARWEPVPGGRDEERCRRLAEAMPGACRALGALEASAPELPSGEVLRQFLSVMVDAQVRGGGYALSREADSPHDRWLTALSGGDGRLAGDQGELAAQIARWRRPLTLRQPTALRLCLRLEEPEGEEAPWRLSYLLQSLADPSLLVPAEEVWSGRASGADVLLAALGRAAALCPGLAASLRQERPCAAPLDAAGAHAFLTEEAWLLEEEGCAVLLPAWWTGGARRVALRAKVQSPPLAAGRGRERLVDVDWEVVLDGEAVTREELEELARLKAPLVRWRGRWVHLDAAQLRSALAFWRRGGAQQMDLSQVLPLALGAAQAAPGLGVDEVAATGWVGDLLHRLEEGAALEEHDPPAAFRGELRPYQRRGLAWLHFLTRWGLGACLADDMGLGKTVQTLALVQERWSAEGPSPVLLVCPTSVLGNWQREAQRFTPELSLGLHHGPQRRRGESFVAWAGGCALVLTSYAVLARDAELLGKVAWRAVVLDEAQNIKNPHTRQARAARTLRAGGRVALTGTPVENHLGDLWSLMEFLNPGLLGPLERFRQRYFLPIQNARDAVATRNLRRLTGPFLLRRLKTDPAVIQDLPEKLEMKVFCTLTREQASLYAAVLAELEEKLDEAEGIQRRGRVLAALTRLKQICNHPAQFLADNSELPGRSGKLARLEEMLEEVLAEGDRALIFTQFAAMGELLRRHLQDTLGREVLFLHGGVPRGRRDRMVQRFQGDEHGPRLFVLSLKAGGTGLNLTRANHVFHFDRWWNPAVEDQATDRAFRIGQERQVQVHKLLCAGTLEERIDRRIEDKRALAADIVGTGEAWLTELSTRQLRELLALGEEAVAD